MHQSLFIFLPKNSEHVIYEDNNKGKIVEVGKIGTNPSTSIENVFLVNGLKHSLLNVHQLCDKGILVSFELILMRLTLLGQEMVLLY